MLFKNKTTKKEILLKENIIISHEKYDVESAINKVGNMLLESGYVQQPYIDAMHQRNESLTVFLGNYLAVPHGEFEAKGFINQSGISVLVLPEGMDWGGNRVYFVVGLAGIGEEHMDILSNIAEIFQEEEHVLSLKNCDSIEIIHREFSIGETT